MCKVYSGTGYSAKQIGYFDGGKIYIGTGYSAKQIGYFEAGKIYSGTGYSAKQAGYIESGGGGCSVSIRQSASSHRTKDKVSLLKKDEG